MEDNIWYLMAAMLIGVIGHLAKEVTEIRQTEGAGFHLKHYLISYPYRTLGVVFTAAGAFLTLYQSDQLNLTSAFLAGYAIDSAANVFSDRVKKVT